jgi:hypothetical protein
VWVGPQVTFGAHSKDSKSALGVALLRTGGIVCGVLLFMGLTIIVLPKSATIESLRYCHKALTACIYKALSPNMLACCGPLVVMRIAILPVLAAAETAAVSHAAVRNLCVAAPALYNSSRSICACCSCGCSREAVKLLLSQLHLLGRSCLSNTHAFGVTWGSEILLAGHTP